MQNVNMNRVLYFDDGFPHDEHDEHDDDLLAKCLCAQSGSIAAAVVGDKMMKHANFDDEEDCPFAKMRDIVIATLFFKNWFTGENVEKTKQQLQQMPGFVTFATDFNAWCKTKFLNAANPAVAQDEANDFDDEEL